MTARCVSFSPALRRRCQTRAAPRAVLSSSPAPCFIHTGGSGRPRADDFSRRRSRDLLTHFHSDHIGDLGNSGCRPGSAAAPSPCLDPTGLRVDGFPGYALDGLSLLYQADIVPPAAPLVAKPLRCRASHPPGTLVRVLGMKDLSSPPSGRPLPASPAVGYRFRLSRSFGGDFGRHQEGAGGRGGKGADVLIDDVAIAARSWPVARPVAVAN